MAFRAVVTGLILLLSLYSPAHAIVPELRQPAWGELTPEQKQILAPLSREWDKMENFRKKQWLGIAKRYPTMKPEEQARIQRRMQDWASLTPEQRAQARTRYKSLKISPPEKKQAIKQKWEEYKELPDEEKQRLAEKAAKAAKNTGPARPLGLAPKLPAAVPQPLQAAPVPLLPQPQPVPASPAAQAESAAPPAQVETPAHEGSSQPPAASPAPTDTPAPAQ